MASIRCNLVAKAEKPSTLAITLPWDWRRLTMAAIGCNLAAKAEKASTLAITLQCDWRRRLKLELMAAPSRRPGETLPASKEKENSRMRHLTRLFVVVAAALLVPPAAAENYPTRPIRLYVAFPPGGAADIVARLVAQPLSARLGQPVVVENKPGSGGNIAGELIAHAAPDGSSLLIGPDNLFTINPHLFSKMSFDPLKDIVPIATVQSNALVLAINAKVPANDLKEFIALAKRSDPPQFYASIGNGSLHHLAMEMLKQEAGIKLTHVPYRGGGPAGAAGVGGGGGAMFGGGTVLPMGRSGEVRGLA